MAASENDHQIIINTAEESQIEHEIVQLYDNFFAKRETYRASQLGSLTDGAYPIESAQILFLKCVINHRLKLAKQVLELVAADGEKFVKALINHKKDDLSVLEIACEFGYKDIVDLLIQYGVDHHTERNILLFAYYASYNNNQLKKQIISSLIRAGADKNPNNKGEMILHAAIFDYDVEFVIFLLDAGADINVRCNAGASPLECAFLVNSEKKKIEFINLLVERGAEITPNFQGWIEKFLLEAIRCGNEPYVSFLVDTVIDVNVRIDEKKLMPSFNPNRNTPLHYAAHLRRRDIVKSLLAKKGIDVNALNIYRQTALHAALCGSIHEPDRMCDVEIIKLLLDSGAECDIEDVYGKYALDYAYISFKLGLLGDIAVIEWIEERQKISTERKQKVSATASGSSKPNPTKTELEKIVECLKSCFPEQNSVEIKFDKKKYQIMIDFMDPFVSFSLYVLFSQKDKHGDNITVKFNKGNIIFIFKKGMDLNHLDELLRNQNIKEFQENIKINIDKILSSLISHSLDLMGISIYNIDGTQVELCYQFKNKASYERFVKILKSTKPMIRYVEQNPGHIIKIWQPLNSILNEEECSKFCNKFIPKAKKKDLPIQADLRIQSDLPEIPLTTSESSFTATSIIEPNIDLKELAAEDVLSPLDKEWAIFEDTPILIKREESFFLHGYEAGQWIEKTIVTVKTNDKGKEDIREKSANEIELTPAQIDELQKVFSSKPGGKVMRADLSSELFAILSQYTQKRYIELIQLLNSQSRSANLTAKPHIPAKPHKKHIVESSLFHEPTRKKQKSKEKEQLRPDAAKPLPLPVSSLSFSVSSSSSGKELVKFIPNLFLKLGKLQPEDMRIARIEDVPVLAKIDDKFYLYRYRLGWEKEELIVESAEKENLDELFKSIEEKALEDERAKLVRVTADERLISSDLLKKCTSESFKTDSPPKKLSSKDMSSISPGFSSQTLAQRDLIDLKDQYNRAELEEKELVICAIYFQLISVIVDEIKSPTFMSNTTLNRSDVCNLRNYLLHEFFLKCPWKDEEDIRLLLDLISLLVGKESKSTMKFIHRIPKIADYDGKKLPPLTEPKAQVLLRIMNDALELFKKSFKQFSGHQQKHTFYDGSFPHEEQSCKTTILVITECYNQLTRRGMAFPKINSLLNDCRLMRNSLAHSSQAAAARELGLPEGIAVSVIEQGKGKKRMRVRDAYAVCQDLYELRKDYFQDKDLVGKDKKKEQEQEQVIASGSKMPLSGNPYSSFSKNRSGDRGRGGHSKNPVNFK